MTTDFTMDTGADGVAIITWDTPGKSMNVMSIEGFRQLDGFIDAALADEAVKGIVITSGKAGSFAGGMDLNVLAKMREDGGDDPAPGVFAGIMQIHTILRKIERAGMDDRNKGGKPIACVLPGTALGIGFEIPLACHRIFAADNPKAKIGLPEIMVGIFPGAGGTTRLSRKLVALHDAMDLPEPLDDLTLKGIPKEPLQTFLEHHGFKTLLNRLGAPAAAVGFRTVPPGRLRDMPVFALDGGSTGSDTISAETVSAARLAGGAMLVVGGAS